MGFSVAFLLLIYGIMVLEEALLLFSCPVVPLFATLWLQHTWLLWPPLCLGVCSDSCPLSQCCYLTICFPLLVLPSVFPSIRVFSNESALRIRWPKYWSFSFSPSNKYSGFISFRIDWFDLLAVQGTLKNHLQHHNMISVG